MIIFCEKLIFIIWILAAVMFQMTVLIFIFEELLFFFKEELSNDLPILDVIDFYRICFPFLNDYDIFINFWHLNYVSKPLLLLNVFLKMCKMNLIFIFFVYVEEDRLHVRVEPDRRNLLGDYLPFEIYYVNVEVFCYYTDKSKVFICIIIEAKAQDFLIIQQFYHI